MCYFKDCMDAVNVVGATWSWRQKRCERWKRWTGVLSVYLYSGDVVSVLFCGVFCFSQNFFHFYLYCWCRHRNNGNTRKPCPSFKVAPTTLSQSPEQTSKVRTVAVTYLQFQIQVCILADRAYVLPRNVSAWPKMFPLWMGSEDRVPEADNTFVRIGYFGPVFRCTHDYTQCLKKRFHR